MPPEAPIWLNAWKTTLAIRPLWYSFGPYTLKNFRPAQKKGLSCWANAHLSKSFLLSP